MSAPILFRQIHWDRPLDASGPVAGVRALAADHASPAIVLETRATGRGIAYLVGSSERWIRTVARRLSASISQAHFTDAEDYEREPVMTAAHLDLSTRHRALRLEHTDSIVRQVLGVFAQLRTDELLVLQLLLGPRRIPLSIPNQSPSSIVAPWYVTAWFGNRGLVDPEKRSALRDKVNDHGFAASVRIGVKAGTARRREALVSMVYSALQIGEAPGLQAKLRREPARRLNDVRLPLRWPLRLNASEVIAWSSWPIGDSDLPGLPPVHPKQVGTSLRVAKGDRIVGDVWAPGATAAIGYSVKDSLRHNWIIGPTGSGKSNLLLTLICQDMQAGRPIVVVEPTDLVADVLARVPENRRDDVALLDPLDAAPIGINPLQAHGRSPELVADSLLGTFKLLYGDAIGPRSLDILSNALSVLAQRQDASLVMLPLLLTNAGFRRSVTQSAIKRDPISAAPFWAWFEGLSDEARSQVTAPLSNKLRPLIRPQLRAVLGQRQPRFNIRQVLTENKILLVPLQKGVIGPDNAELLGALVVSELWLALRERRAIPASKRTPVMIMIDEVQDYLRLPGDLADALATSRSLGAGWHLAHQHTGQLGPTMRAAFETNARSRIAFQLTATDARVMAAGQNVLKPEDFTSLPAYHVYAALMRGNAVQPWVSATTRKAPPPISDPADVRRRSREQFGRPLDEIEADFAALLDESTAASSATAATGRRRRSAT